MSKTASLNLQASHDEDRAAQALAACYRLLIEAAKAAERRRQTLQEIGSTDGTAAESKVRAIDCELGASPQVQRSDESAMAQ